MEAVLIHTLQSFLRFASLSIFNHFAGWHSSGNSIKVLLQTGEGFATTIGTTLCLSTSSPSGGCKEKSLVFSPTGVFALV